MFERERAEFRLETVDGAELAEVSLSLAQPLDVPFVRANQLELVGRGQETDHRLDRVGVEDLVVDGLHRARDLVERSLDLREHDLDVAPALQVEQRYERVLALARRLTRRLGGIALSLGFVLGILAEQALERVAVDLVLVLRDVLQVFKNRAADANHGYDLPVKLTPSQHRRRGLTSELTSGRWRRRGRDTERTTALGRGRRRRRRDEPFHARHRRRRRRGRRGRHTGGYRRRRRGALQLSSGRWRWRRRGAL